MTRERQSRFSLLPLVMLMFSLAAGSCLNPISFDESMLPTLNVNVSGSVSVAIDDVAVMWLINRTKTVDVTEVRIDRPMLAGETSPLYPQVYNNKPRREQSFASYHTATQAEYTIQVAWKDYKDNVSGDPGNATLNVQFPRNQDYRYYLYRSDKDGTIKIVRDDQLNEVADPEDDTNPPSPPSSVDAQTFVVINVTPDQDVGSVDFVKSSTTYSISGGPRKKDQQMLLLGTGQYRVTAAYTKNGPKTTDEKTAIVTMEPGSMAVRTNFLYFYKTISGDYQLTQRWPPNPNDAAGDNKPEDALTDTQAILQITNAADPSLPDDIVTGITINGSVYLDPANTIYLLPGDIERYIVDAGPSVPVNFMAKRDNPADMEWGMTISRNIQPKKVNYLQYTNNLAKPDVLPPDLDGFGVGLIRITNNSDGVVYGTYIYDKETPSKSTAIAYSGFTPPRPINYGQIGRVLVTGDADFPLEEGKYQIVQVLLETMEGLMVVEKQVYLRNSIVSIVISQDSLKPSNLPGSRVTVTNSTTTSTIIRRMEVFNTGNPDVYRVFGGLDINSSGGFKAVDVLSSPGFPILDGSTYSAILTVEGNGGSALIAKPFVSDGLLYSTTPSAHTRTVTLTEGDLPTWMTTFKEVTTFKFPDAGLSVNSLAQLDGATAQVALTAGGQIDLSGYLQILPLDATKRGPVEWELEPGGNANNEVSFDPDTSRLTVTGYSAAGSPYVMVKATIRQAKGTASVKTDATATVRVNLTYTLTPKPYPVTSFIVSPGTIGTDGYLDLSSLVGSWTPAYANNGVSSITAHDLEWEIDGITLDSLVSGSIFHAGSTPGSVKVKATLPSTRNNNAGAVIKTGSITIETSAAPKVDVTGITLTSPNPVLRYYTHYNQSNSRVLSSSSSLNLTALVTISPANATVTSPVNWTIEIGGTAVAGTVSISGDSLFINAGNLPTGTQTVLVKPTIPNAKAGGTQDFEGNPFTVTLVEINSRPVYNGQLSIADKTITVGETFNMNAQVTLPVGASINGVPIAKEDLTWTATPSPHGTITASGLATGLAEGTFTVAAVLPSEKNGGFGAVSATATVTVGPKPHPASITFRFFHVNKHSDHLVQLGRIATADTAWKDDYPIVLTTGQTGYCWTKDGSDPTYLDAFKKRYPFPKVEYYTFSGKGLYEEWSYEDVTFPWPEAPNTGWYLFFIEHDNRVRGYSASHATAPARTDNFLFYLHPETLLQYIIPMKGSYEASSSDSAAVLRVPIGYNTKENTASIMKSLGVGKQPLHHLNGF